MALESGFLGLGANLQTWVPEVSPLASLVTEVRDRDSLLWLCVHIMCAIHDMHIFLYVCIRLSVCVCLSVCLYGWMDG